MVSSSVTADETSLDLDSDGKFFSSKALPRVAFFMSPIEHGDISSLKTLLKNQDIKVLVLDSVGGQIYDALLMAEVLFDEGISTYIPSVSFITEEEVINEEPASTANCASSCAYLFFAGRDRVAVGQLGVHQTSTSKDIVGNLAESEFATQYVTSEIIRQLNRFDTPPFVYERMFYDTEMYYFSGQEIELINSVKEKQSSNRFDEVETFIKSYNQAVVQEYKRVEAITAEMNYN